MYDVHLSQPLDPSRVIDAIAAAIGADRAEVQVDDDLAPRLEWAPQANGSIQLLGFGPEGAAFDVQSSQDLRIWQTLTGVRLTTLGFDKGTPISAADLSGTGRFYRLRSP